MSARSSRSAFLSQLEYDAENKVQEYLHAFLDAFLAIHDSFLYDFGISV